MKPARFSLRALFLFTTSIACFLSLNRQYEAWPPPNAFIHYSWPRPMDDRCLRAPHTITCGWPFVLRTDHLAYHPRHKTGPCKFDSIYHPLGVTANILIAIFASTTLAAMTLYLFQFVSWRLRLRREDRIIDRMTESA